MPKNILIEKKHSGKSSHKKTSHHVNQNGSFPKNASIKQYLPKKIFNNNNIALGLIAMGLAGTATLLILNKRRNANTMTRKLYNIGSEAREFANDAFEKGKRAYDTVSDYAENFKDAAYDAVEQPYSRSLLLAGAVGGTLLGASLVYFLNSKREDRTFLGKAIDTIDSLKDMASNAKDNVKSIDWGNIANDFIETVSERLFDDREEEESTHGRSRGHTINNLQNVVDMGIRGFRLWQKLKNKR